MEIVRLTGDKMERIDLLRKMGFERGDAVKTAEVLEGRRDRPDHELSQEKGNNGLTEG